MRPGSWFFGIIVGLLTGLIVAVPMTIADWRLNPSGLCGRDCSELVLACRIGPANRDGHNSCVGIPHPNELADRSNIRRFLYRNSGIN
jgi:hypothetical protein